MLAGGGEKDEIMGDRRPRVLLKWYLVHIFKSGLALFLPNTFLDANKFSVVLAAVWAP